MLGICSPKCLTLLTETVGPPAQAQLHFYQYLRLVVRYLALP